MNLERLESLLWELHDGTISADDLAELEQQIEHDSDALAIQREIEQLAERLDKVDRKEPPTELRTRISEALAQVSAQPVQRPAVASSPLPKVTGRRPTGWLPIAASLIVGAIVGYLVQPGSGVSIDTSQAAGSMSARSESTAVREYEIDLSDGRGLVSWSKNGNRATVGIEIAADTELEIDLEVADGFVLVTGVNPANGSDLEVVTTIGRTVVRANGPIEQRLEIENARASNRVHVVVRADGSVVAEDWWDGEVEG